MRSLRIKEDEETSGSEKSVVEIVYNNVDRNGRCQALR
jgi:hypothetical protein